MSYKFFSNTTCEYFPCHKVDDLSKFNCLFCYCPLFQYEDCGGEYSYFNGIKDCSNCTKPHLDYDFVITKLKEHMNI